MNLDGDVDMVAFDTAEQSAEIVIAPQKKIPPLEYYRSFFWNEKLTPVDTYWTVTSVLIPKFDIFPPTTKGHNWGVFILFLYHK